MSIKHFVKMMIDAEDVWSEVVDIDIPNKELNNQTNQELVSAMYSSQGVDMPAEQTINKRVSKLEERDDCDSYVSDSEEEDSDNGN